MKWEKDEKESTNNNKRKTKFQQNAMRLNTEAANKRRKYTKCCVCTLYTHAYTRAAYEYKQKSRKIWAQKKRKFHSFVMFFAMRLSLYHNKRCSSVRVSDGKKALVKTLNVRVYRRSWTILHRINVLQKTKNHYALFTH